MNLIVSEFVMMTVGLPFDILAAYYNGWKLGYSSCLFLGFMMTLTGMSDTQKNNQGQRVTRFEIILR